MTNHRSSWTRAGLALIAIASLPAQTPKGEQDWPYFGGDQAGTKYSSLSDINTG